MAVGIPAWFGGGGGTLAVAAQVEFETKILKQFLIIQFQALVPGALNVGLIGSTCTALPGGCGGQQLGRGLAIAVAATASEFHRRLTALRGRRRTRAVAAKVEFESKC